MPTNQRTPASLCHAWESQGRMHADGQGWVEGEQQASRIKESTPGRVSVVPVSSLLWTRPAAGNVMYWSVCLLWLGQQRIQQQQKSAANARHAANNCMTCRRQVINRWVPSVQLACKLLAGFRSDLRTDRLYRSVCMHAHAFCTKQGIWPCQCCACCPATVTSGVLPLRALVACSRMVTVITL